MAGAQRTIDVRTYTAKDQEKAAALFAADAQTLATQGLYPSNQIWSGPRYWRLVLTPIILVAVGILISGIYGAAIGAAIGVVYIILVRPKGSLTVTYTAQAVQPQPHGQPQYQTQPSPPPPPSGSF